MLGRGLLSFEKSHFVSRFFPVPTFVFALTYDCLDRLVPRKYLLACNIRVGFTHAKFETKPYKFALINTVQFVVVESI